MRSGARARGVDARGSRRDLDSPTVGTGGRGFTVSHRTIGMRDSIWFQTLSDDQLGLLDESDPLPRSAEVAIIGAGLIGVSAAYFLSQAGVADICVIDRGRVLGEASGANAGGLWFAQQSPELGPIAALARASSVLYDELASQFDFDFRRCGMVELLDDERQIVEAEARLATVREAGFRAEKVAGKHARSLEPGLGFTPSGALYYPDEACLHPARLGAELMRHLKGNGVRFCLGNEVGELTPQVQTAQGSLEAKTTVIASGAWTPQVTRALGWEPPIKPMRGTLLAVEPLPEILHHTVLTTRYYYWQLSSGHIGGGGSIDDVGFEQGVDPATTKLIREEMERLVPAVVGQPTACAWSGFRPYCEDMRPVIGPVPRQEGTFVAAGHFKKGVMLAPVTGKILADLITQGKTDLPMGPLDPARFK